MRVTIIVEMPDNEKVDELSIEGMNGTKLKRYADIGNLRDGNLFLLEALKDSNKWSVNEVTE